MGVNVISLPERAKVEAKSYLEQLLSEGARKLLQAAIENEVCEYLQGQSNRRVESGERRVVRNGYLPERDLVTGVGPVKIRQPRVRHRDGGTFSSEILPKYLRRVPSIDALIAALYLRGIPSGDFTEALAAILGEKAAGLSATNIVRLKAGWEEEYKAWCQRDLSTKRYVYWWADGIYFNIRLDEERSCVLVLIGALEDGTKELLVVVESTFATVRLRTQRTKGCGSRIATLTMVFKLGTQAQQHWRRLNGSELIPKVVSGVQFIDGEEFTEQAA